MSTSSEQSISSISDVLSKLLVEKAGRGHSKKYQVTFEKFVVSLPDLTIAKPEFSIELITGVMDRILATVLDPVTEHALVRLRIESKYLGFPIWTPPIQRSQLSVERWMEEVARVLNSQEEFCLDGTFNVEVHYAEPAAGKGGVLLDEMLKRKQCVLRIENVDDLCLV